KLQEGGRLSLGERHYAQARSTHQRTAGKASIRFYLTQRYRSGQRSRGLDVDGGPYRAVRRRIAIRRSRYAAQADDAALLTRMVNEDFVVQLHRPQVIACLEIAHAVPTRGSSINEVLPTELLGFRLHQPLWHVVPYPPRPRSESKAAPSKTWSQR